jgi:FkbM family methyltransferase
LFPDIYVRFNLHDLTQRSTFWQGERFEFPTAHVLESWGGTSFFDIGANYGFYSLFTLTKFPGILVFAFEPNPSTYEHILQIKKDNGLKQLQIFNMGLGSRATEADLYLGGDDSGHSTFLYHPEFLDHSIEKIKIETFDQWREDQKLDLPKKPEWMAKIDVEGMELDVLIGMKKALKAKAFKGILVEVLDFTLALANHKPEDIFNFMTSAGYKPMDKADLLRR